MNQGPGSEAVPWESPSIDFVGTTPRAVATSTFSIAELGEPVKPLLHKNTKSVSPRGPGRGPSGPGPGPWGLCGARGATPGGSEGPLRPERGRAPREGGPSKGPPGTELNKKSLILLSCALELNKISFFVAVQC